MTLQSLLDLEPSQRDAWQHVSMAYAAENGSRSLRKAIADHLSSTSQEVALTPLEPEDIVVTSGSEESIYLTMAAMLGAGQGQGAHVIVHTPCYQSLLQLSAEFGATVSIWPAIETDGWRPSLAALRSLLRPETKLLVCNFPHNPTGWFPDAAYVRELLAIVDDAGVMLLSDEVYAGLDLYGGLDFTPMAMRTTRAITIGSMSKAFGMPGVRLGWIVNRSPAFLARLNRLHQFTNTYPVQASEFLTQIALRHAPAILERGIKLARAHFSGLEAMLDDMPHMFTWHKPLAGVVCFPRLRSGSAARLSADVRDHLGLNLAHSGLMQHGDAHVRFGFGTRGLSDVLAELHPWLALRPPSR